MGFCRVADLTCINAPPRFRPLHCPMRGLTTTGLDKRLNQEE